MKIYIYCINKYILYVYRYIYPDKKKYIEHGFFVSKIRSKKINREINRETNRRGMRRAPHFPPKMAKSIED